MTQLVILGTSHPLQCGDSSVSASQAALFENELHRLVENHQIRRIAEEMSPEGLARYNVARTIGEKVATSLGLEHYNVDLNAQERNSLGLNDQPLSTIREIHNPADSGAWFRDSITIVADEVRERVWLSRLLVSKTWPTLFICGAKHVQPIRRLWHQLALEYILAHSDYVP